MFERAQGQLPGYEIHFTAHDKAEEKFIVATTSSRRLWTILIFSGQVAATNALSDVYAMGGQPITALAHVCFPASGDLEVLGRSSAGGLSKMMEASCTVVGGHSVRDEETKFGYSVTGLIHPRPRVCQRRRPTQ